MAGRSPTSFNEFNDETELHPRKIIKTTVPSAITDDQQFVLDIESQLMADCSEPQSTTNTSYDTLRTIKLKPRDLCGVTASESCEFCILAWSTGSSDFTVAITDGATTGAIAVTADHGTKKWRGWGSITLATDGSEETIQIQAKRDSGSGNVYVAGIAIFSA